MMGYGFGFGGFFMILFWGLIIWAIFALVRNNGGGGCCGMGHGHGRGNGETDAMETLRQRYAKGDITKEQFEEIKKDLQ